MREEEVNKNEEKNYDKQKPFQAMDADGALPCHIRVCSSNSTRNDTYTTDRAAGVRTG
jgi:hypothetical protein